MSKWILIENLVELEKTVRSLKKKCRGHFISNYDFYTGKLADDIKYTEIFCRKDGDNIYLIERYDDMYKFYYFIGDVNNFQLVLPQSIENSILVCEVLEIEGLSKQEQVICKLDDYRFKQYKQYHMWESEITPEKEYWFENSLFSVKEGASQEDLEKLYEIFDRLSDRLPMKKKFDDYCKSMHFLSCMAEGKCVGLINYKIVGKTGTSDFVCAFNDFPGAGSYLGMVLGNIYRDNGVKKTFGWIEDLNTESIKMNKRLNMKRSNQRKRIFVRNLHSNQVS